MPNGWFVCAMENWMSKPGVDRRLRCYFAVRSPEVGSE